MTAAPDARPDARPDAGPGADPDAGRITLQRVIFPENGICTEQDLYFHFAGPGGYYDHPRGARMAEAGTAVLLDSYFNALSVGKWHAAGALDGLWLAIAGAGAVELKVWHAIPDRSWELLASQVMTLAADEALVDLSHYADNAVTGLVWFEWRPAGGRGSAATMTGARYLTRAPEGPLPRLAICITTFRREAAVAQTVARLSAFLAGFRWGERIRIIVVDNGQSAAIPPSPHVLAVANPNLGGAGGFARGLIEAEGWGATHCLFMDDDASFHMENIARTYTFLALARDPKVALAGAMINNTHKWAMWENGAVFDRSCIPLYCGLDLRRRENVIHLEFTSLHERRRTLYGGWWFFAFPVAAVTRRPFPFFVRGDDVSFSIANRFRIVTLNGVVSFQDDFTAKESPQTLYLDLRSHLVHHLVFDAIDRGGWGTARVALRFIARSLARFHYETAEAQMLAWEDVMKGPAFFRDHADMADRRAAIRALARTETWGPLDDLDLTERRRITPRRGRLATRLFALTVNGHLLPFFRLWGDRIVLPVGDRGTLHPVWGASRITYLDGTRTKGYQVALSGRRFLAAVWRAGRLALRFRRVFPALRAEYRAAYPQMTALPFWQEMLGLAPPAAEAAEAAPPAEADRTAPALPATGTAG